MRVVVTGQCGERRCHSARASRSWSTTKIAPANWRLLASPFQRRRA
jgi:hypothetical protein